MLQLYLLPLLNQYRYIVLTKIQSLYLASYLMLCLPWVRYKYVTTCIHQYNILPNRFVCCVQLFATPWTVAHQVPPPMRFSRQGYWSGLPFASPGHHFNPGIEPGSPALQTDSLRSEPPQNSFAVLKISSAPSTHITLPSTLATTDLFTVSMILPFPECHTVGILQCIAFLRLASFT